MAEVLELSLCKQALVERDLHSCLKQAGEDLFYVLQVCFKFGARDENVIEVDLCSSPIEACKEGVHGPLEDGGGVGNAEEEPQIGELSSSGDEGKLVAAFGVDHDLVETQMKEANKMDKELVELIVLFCCQEVNAEEAREGLELYLESSSLVEGERGDSVEAADVFHDGGEVGGLRGLELAPDEHVADSTSEGVQGVRSLGACSLKKTGSRKPIASTGEEEGADGNFHFSISSFSFVLSLDPFRSLSHLEAYGD
uniref:Uncharacterized protein n=1 Tax=Chromera velia CCMP2878 TaxID=1169474 RepID=A0A0G4IEX1_9ALVE|eukprot:Cvel_13801.t1-p1 / transcript=Cvel_13801.t1 / gene=Cvel_13801 / organism=Chromera_velia_CCMP2878 / gene_product=Retrovirus-related Pol polyprotein from transposon, putative / transcript_product=Retrovirus-related Pol polyprotein from transposon, putative / location=Cvel_scaffold957:24758-30876(+) / protein_length=253 / sequence_SO=supercontig / SO=protein_coding / is_pseudo=false